MGRYVWVLLVLLSVDARAAIFCVSNGDALNSAFNDARDNSQHDEIRITVGTHTSITHAPQDFQFQLELIPNPNFILVDDEYDLTISGGWSTGNNCASQISLDPSSTVLDAALQGPGLKIIHGVPELPFTATLTLSNLTINRGKAFPEFTLQASGLFIGGRLGAPGSIVVDNVHVVNGQGNALDALALSAGGSGSQRLRNSIVSLNNLTHPVSSALNVRSLDNVVAFVSNNSVFANSVQDTGAGMEVTGIATVSNNAVADNTSAASPSYQFFSNAPTSLTLINNHFASKSFDNGSPFSEINTTTGNAFWAGLGVERLPLEVSPLRDSGDNSPAGGALAIDFKGNPRIVNTTIDRGASEAPLADNPLLGPAITDLTPVKGSTTWLAGEPGESAFGQIQFAVSGGDPGGLTLIECQVTSGTVLFASDPNQWVATGQSAVPVTVGFDGLSEAVQSGVVFCNFKRFGGSGLSFAAYTFKGGLQELFLDGFETP